MELRRIVLGNVVDRLNKDSSSPWYGSIVLPGDTAFNSKIIRATSIIPSLTPVYSWLKETIFDQECNNQKDEVEYVYNIVANYWNALKAVVPRAFDDPNEYVIQKTPGLFSLHKLLKHLLHSIYIGRREFNVATFRRAKNPHYCQRLLV